jgi:hypothetical protein
LAVGEALIPQQEGAQDFHVVMERGWGVALLPAVDAGLKREAVELRRL